MRPVLAILALLAVGVAAPADARQAPPKKPVAAAKKPAKKKPCPRKAAKRKACGKKPARKPGAKQPARTPVVTAPTTAPSTGTPAGETPAETPATGPAPATDPTPPPVTTPLSRVLSVTEKEFSLTLSRTTLGAGDVTIQVRNWGEDPHDLRIDSIGGIFSGTWNELAPGAIETKAFALTAGSYRLWCTLPGHAALGMDKQISVAAG
jgi:hypothetical protein